jgi:hypothetical protein
LRSWRSAEWLPSVPKATRSRFRDATTAWRNSPATAAWRSRSWTNQLLGPETEAGREAAAELRPLLERLGARALLAILEELTAATPVPA